MGDGTPNEYYAIAVWEIDALVNNIDGKLIKIKDDQTIFAIKRLCEISKNIATASATFWYDTQEELIEIKKTINEIKCRPDHTESPEAIEKDVLSLIDHVTALELRIGILEEKRKYKPRIKPSKARFRRT